MNDTPFTNCKYKTCDLPGQCVAEGKCHHPADKRIADLERQVDEAYGLVYGVRRVKDGEINELKRQLAEVKEKYNDLLYQVAKKVIRESRHDTAPDKGEK